MKIEMGESLFLSWLRHVKQCQIVQLNWKPSNSWDLANEKRIAELLQVFRDFIDSKYQRELFGKKGGQGYSQILRQGEIDALGFELKDGRIISVYAIDVAFHEGGLNYGTLEETICRVIKKLARTAMIILGYFGIDQGEVIFASPKISPKTYIQLEATIREVSDIASKIKLNFRFRLFGNQDFQDRVISPIISLSGEVADTSELFMRSIQLCQLFGKQSIIKKKSKSMIENAHSGAASDEVKIGQLARTTFNRLFSEKKLTQKMLENLQDATYSKKTFGIQYAVLKRIGPNAVANKQGKDDKGQPRYWSHEFDNGRYLVCSQWYERHRGNLTQWAREFK